MAYEATGDVFSIGETRQISERFRVREIALIIADNPKYPQFVQFQVSGDRCEALDTYQEGDRVTVEFNLRGRQGKNGDKIFNSLDVWKIGHAVPKDAPGGLRQESRSSSTQHTTRHAPREDDRPPPVDDDLPY